VTCGDRRGRTCCGDTPPERPLPGCLTRGGTVEECRERAVEAIETHIAGLQADGEQVPEETGEAELLAVTVAA
jgi:predicted RNase H-like HicB family nuclease